jgi:hypothetical protein
VITLPASARYAALGGAGTALNGDAGAVFSNPAGLATIKHAAIEAAFQRYPDGTLETMGAGAVRLLQFDLGGGYHYVKFTDTSAVRDNVEWVGSLVYRFGAIALGSSAKYVSLEDSSSQVSRALTADVGLELAVFDILALGVSVHNLGDHRISGSPLRLPNSTNFGFTFNFVDPQSNARLLGTVEAVWAEGQPRRTVVGLEAGAVFYGVGVVVRGGYGEQAAGSGHKKASFGGGVVLGRLGVDYAYQQRTTLGDQVHRIGARWTL